MPRLQADTPAWHWYPLPGRYEEIEAALGNPAATAMLLMAHPYQDTLAELIGFVRTARLALPSVLGVSELTAGNG